MESRIASVGFLLLSLIACAKALPGYRARIPNVGQDGGAASLIPAPWQITGVADNVGITCASIGHADQCGGPPSGGGNPFGQAFNANAQSFAAICRMDSDGDGLSNGMEVGDPYCTWTQGTTPNRTMCLSHPGFPCATPTDPHCQGWVTKPECAGYDVARPTTSATSAPSTPFTAAPHVCPAAASALTDDERYRAYHQCWVSEFVRWQTAFNAWLASGAGQGCPT